MMVVKTHICLMPLLMAVLGCTGWRVAKPSIQVTYIRPFEVYEKTSPIFVNGFKPCKNGLKMEVCITHKTNGRDFSYTLIDPINGCQFLYDDKGNVTFYQNQKRIDDYQKSNGPQQGIIADRMFDATLYIAKSEEILKNYIKAENYSLERTNYERDFGIPSAFVLYKISGQSIYGSLESKVSFFYDLHDGNLVTYSLHP